MKKEFKKKRDAYAQAYDTIHDFDRNFVDFRFDVLVKHTPHLGRALEVGCADGLMTKRLLPIATSLDVIEPAAHYIEKTRQYVGEQNGLVTFYNDTLEAFQARKTYDTIVLSSILHESEDPVRILKKASDILNSDGILYINVPNARSLHRRIGVALGMLKNEYDFSERDKKFLHQKNYDLSSLLGELKGVGLKIVASGGYFLKFFPNKTMESWDQNYVNALYTVSKDAPADLCAEIYAFVKK